MLHLNKRPLHADPRIAALDAEEDDAELVDRLRIGDRRAEELLYRRYSRYLAATVSRLVGAFDDAEDIIHDTFLIAFAKIGSLRAGEAVRSWLAQIAISQVHRRLRRRRLLRRLGMDRDLSPEGLAALAGVDCGADARADLARLDDVLSRVPVAERTAWMLRRVEGWSLEEVAHSCQCSLATVKRRITAADKRVRKVIDLETEEQDR